MKTISGSRHVVYGIRKTQGPRSQFLMTGGGEGRSDRGSYFILKKITISEFVYPKKSLSPFIATPKNPYVFFSRPKKIPASFIDPKKSILAKMSAPKTSLGPLGRKTIKPSGKLKKYSPNSQDHNLSGSGGALRALILLITDLHWFEMCYFTDVLSNIK